MKTTKNKAETTEALPKLTPIILLLDNVLKVHKIIDLDSVQFMVGRQYEELPSFPFTPDKYKLLLKHKIKFRVECNVNIDPDNLRVACEQHNMGNLQWYTPKYVDYLDDVLFDVKLLNTETNKVKYARVTLTTLEDMLETYELQLLSGGRLTAKQAKGLGLILVEGEYFSYYQAK